MLSYKRKYQVITEYERAVLFRLGRLQSGGAKGPGLFNYIYFNLTKSLILFNEYFLLLSCTNKNNKI